MDWTERGDNGRVEVRGDEGVHAVQQDHEQRFPPRNVNVLRCYDLANICRAGVLSRSAAMFVEAHPEQHNTSNRVEEALAANNAPSEHKDASFSIKYTSGAYDHLVEDLRANDNAKAKI